MIFVISDSCVKMAERTLLQQYVQIAVVVAAYWFISITLGELIKKGQSLVERANWIIQDILFSVCQQISVVWLDQAGCSTLCHLVVVFFSKKEYLYFSFFQKNIYTLKVPVCGHCAGLLCSQAARPLLPWTGESDSAFEVKCVFTKFYYCRSPSLSFS